MQTVPPTVAPCDITGDHKRTATSKSGAKAQACGNATNAQELSDQGPPKKGCLIGESHKGSWTGSSRNQVSTSFLEADESAISANVPPYCSLEALEKVQIVSNLCHYHFALNLDCFGSLEI